VTITQINKPSVSTAMCRFCPLDLLSAVVSAGGGTDRLVRLHALGIDHRGGRCLLAATRHADPAAQPINQPLRQTPL
jgi:hypothetical protein